jgi:hypothetical protein
MVPWAVPLERRYEDDALYFDPRVRGEKLEELWAKLWEAVAPVMREQVRNRLYL